MRGSRTASARRKHRLFIDVTFSTAVSRCDAAKGLQLVLNTRLDLAKCQVWAFERSPYIDKVTVLEAKQGV